MLRDMIRNGPAENAGLPRMMLGMALWWRLWATLFFHAAPLAFGVVVLAYSSPGVAIMATWASAGLLGPTMLKVTPKYEIKKNY